MPKNISAINTNRLNTCPHGLPQGACPICNGTGSTASAKQTNNIKKPGEMTWSECFAMGQLMKLRRERAEARSNSPLYNASMQANLENNVKQYVNNVQQLVSSMQKLLPQPLAKVFGLLNQVLITPFLALVSKLPGVVQNVQKFFSNVQSFLASVAEKLTTVLGELKNFAEKKASDIFNGFRKKVRKWFFGLEDEKEEYEEQILETLSTRKD